MPNDKLPHDVIPFVIDIETGEEAKRRKPAKPRGTLGTAVLISSCASLIESDQTERDTVKSLCRVLHRVARHLARKA